MHDNCFFVDGRNILKWAMQAVALTAAKLQNTKVSQFLAI